MEELIKQVLLNLDQDNDDNWTEDGLPRLDVVSEELGEKVSRKEVTDAFPDFVRGYESPEEDSVGAEEDEDQEEDEAEEDQPGPESDPEEETVVAFDRRLEELSQQIKNLQDEYHQTQIKRDDFVQRSQNGGEPDTNGKAIQRYLKAQNKVRAERANRSGGPVRSPLDQAFIHRGKKRRGPFGQSQG